MQRRVDKIGRPHDALRVDGDRIRSHPEHRHLGDLQLLRVQETWERDRKHCGGEFAHIHNMGACGEDVNR